MVIKRSLAFIFILFILLTLPFCENKQMPGKNVPKSDSLFYLNHSDTARYVGMDACRQCHSDIYNSFIKTGMGKSLDVAKRSKSSAGFSDPTIYDRFSDFHYKAFWDHDSLYMHEYRLGNSDTIHSRIEQVNFIIGSGQHTNSHLQSVNGYINQMPMTYYTQIKKWDLPPGFENGINTRFSRKIGLECMTCHNGYPDFVMGSENKFRSVPSGIDCERCHGPGSIHVNQRKFSSPIDTSRYIDRSIVNPAKLSIDAQFDICQRCHLQGNAILKNGKSFYDFKPGQKLSDYISVFAPKYKNADDEFIMASHAERLKLSPCFIKSLEKGGDTKSLKPYKNAMTCITCHNPHVSVTESNNDFFNNACKDCHGKEEEKKLAAAHQKSSLKSWTDCVTCHMPLSGSTDIPHVTVHDHYIRKPVSKKEKDKIKTFIGLYSVNEKQPDNLTRAFAYINQHDKFDREHAYLDSAEKLLSTEKDLRKKLHALVQLHFIKQEYHKVLKVVQQAGEMYCYDSVFTKQSYANNDAWAAYRIAESCLQSQKEKEALKWLNRAVQLSPYNLDFRNKLGSTLAASKNIPAAIEQFEFIMGENPKLISCYSNLGYLELLQGNREKAIKLYKKGLALDPDNEALLLNLSGYYMYMNDRISAKKYLDHLIKINPRNKQARQVLDQLSI